MLAPAKRGKYTGRHMDRFFDELLPKLIKRPLAYVLVVWLIFAGIGLGFVLVEQELAQTINVLAHLAEVFTAGALLLAVASFYYQQRRDQVTSVIDQIEFFRKEIIPAHETWRTHAREYLNDKSRLPSEGPIREFTYEAFSTQHPDIARRQAKLAFAADTPDDLTISQCNFINMLEEFSLRVLNTESAEAEALYSIRENFLNYVEENAVRILMAPKLLGEGEFIGIRELYELWRDLDATQATKAAQHESSRQAIIGSMGISLPGADIS